ncbi:sporulation integral membrane protein YlbJ [Paenibacillus antri]|uniref:Sporulation integral membrane protein YlbJ n=2 Tax=Paenibacillus antri TaxID=2582848 RepID=A0A5R9GNP8_9BACL|nr:sporulation integral membrane protein YlbJ [Paenibacillus antri]
MSVAVLALVLAFPRESVEAGLTGVAIWWDVLFPSLFPFFVVSELMLGFGIVHFFGKLLDPMMRPLFRLPGPGGFVMAMGFASGYPVGARLTSQLWDARLVNRGESERLVAFTTTADPIFLIGAVAVGFFHDATLAPLLAAAHYGGAVLLGLLLRLQSRGEPSGEASAAADDGRKRPLLLRAFDAMHDARLSDGRPFGELLLDGIRSGLRLIVVVGGLVVFFSVVIEVLTLARVVTVMQGVVAFALGLFAIPAPLAEAVVNGLFEVTLGAKTAGAATGISLQAQVAIASFGLSWAGLSVHAQIMSIVSHMPVRYGKYAAAKALQGLFSGAIAYFAWPLFAPFRESAAAWIPAASPSGWSAAAAYAPFAGLAFLVSLAAVPAVYVLYRLLRPLVRPR